jgi:hypothetical protein
MNSVAYFVSCFYFVILICLFGGFFLNFTQNLMLWLFWVIPHDDFSKL